MEKKLKILHKPADKVGGKFDKIKIINFQKSSIFLGADPELESFWEPLT